MALIDVKCHGSVEHRYEVERPAAMWPATPDCPTCGATTEQYHPQPRMQYRVEPVVLYRGPDGQIRFVGDANGVSAHDYRQRGYEEIRLQGVGEVRRFEKHMNAHEYSRAVRRAEKAQENREAREKHTRSQLRDVMTSMTPFGRALARAAISKNDNKPRPQEHARDPGFHSDVYSNDRSNRAESRDAQGRRRRD